jgi:hypothetical protein
LFTTTHTSPGCSPLLKLPSRPARLRSAGLLKFFRQHRRVPPPDFRFSPWLGICSSPGLVGEPARPTQAGSSPRSSIPQRVKGFFPAVTTPIQRSIAGDVYLPRHPQDHGQAALVFSVTVFDPGLHTQGGSFQLNFRETVQMGIPHQLTQLGRYMAGPAVGAFRAGQDQVMVSDFLQAGGERNLAVARVADPTKARSLRRKASSAPMASPSVSVSLADGGAMLSSTTLPQTAPLTGGRASMAFLSAGFITAGAPCGSAAWFQGQWLFCHSVWDPGQA